MTKKEKYGKICADFISTKNIHVQGIYFKIGLIANVLKIKDILLHYFNNNIENFNFFITKGKSENKEDFIEYEMRVKIEDSELSELLVKELKLNNINEFKELDEEEFKKGIEFLKNLQYTSFIQISRVVKINRYQLEKYWK